jgi:hypothetical protein
VRLEVYVKKKLIGSVLLQEFHELVKEKQRTSWESLSPSKAFINIGLTPEGFGKEPETSNPRVAVSITNFGKNLSYTNLLFHLLHLLL